MATPIRLDYISIFPEYFDVLHISLLGRAVEHGLVDVRSHDLRTWTHDRHRTVDDTPCGGGAGMVMKPDPWGEAFDELLGTEPDADVHIVIPTPSGHPFRQQIAADLSDARRIVFCCGRYEGIDHRVIEYASRRWTVHELSLGDYVLNGGEVAALAITEAVVRLIPGVIGNPESLTEESYSAGQEGLLEYPVYTRPISWRGHDVPEVLMSGHHGRIAAWRHDRSVAITAERRPDLLGGPDGGQEPTQPVRS
ncbi:tRNA (guanine-N(1)-)-methyltransferase [Acidipropionibacterium acidipropionici ATCC 4875]|uniref:tRNA (guanine-N(1)-)-methyltransferase n=1 Tax=Acidipropionibacterium acidipropionici (strain ATCC 4875 / DSM 20272 / JCM 6432 / NBRC 12425 / NCIMB 8070 / 4) TaxID=1171373 RepID=K7SKY7_ACIA4|nr:tRNA (guanine-N(1)-)-methyltransferase [Acidipropionibacterium acidipropionici ATCC 4875]